MKNGSGGTEAYREELLKMAFALALAFPFGW